MCERKPCTAPSEWEIVSSALRPRMVCPQKQHCQSESSDALSSVRLPPASFMKRGFPPNENKLSDRRRERAWLPLKLF